MRFPILLFCLAAAGCGKKPAPSCDVVAAHVQELNGGGTDALAVGLRDVFTKRCTEDVWSDDMRRCLHGTKSLVEPQSCKQKLNAEQVKRFDADLAELDEKVEKTIIPGACVRYEKMLVAVKACDVLPKEAREQLQKNFDAYKATWPSVPDKRTLEPICGAAIKTVKGIATTCPGAASW